MIVSLLAVSVEDSRSCFVFSRFSRALGGFQGHSMGWMAGVGVDRKAHGHSWLLDLFFLLFFFSIQESKSFFFDLLLVLFGFALLICLLDRKVNSECTV